MLMKFKDIGCNPLKFKIPSLVFLCLEKQQIFFNNNYLASTKKSKGRIMKRKKAETWAGPSCRNRGAVRLCMRKKK